MVRALTVCVFVITLSRSMCADPITAGSWALTPHPKGAGFPFYDGPSFDCDHCGVAFWLPPGVEYLNDGHGGPVPFTFTNFPGAMLSLHRTAWQSGTLSWNPDTGAFVYDTGTGYRHSSTQGMAMSLFRSRRGAGTDYWLAVEDLPPDWPIQDHDYNDAVYAWTQGPGTQPDPEPAPTPEPSTLVLLSASALMIARVRKTRSADLET